MTRDDQTCLKSPVIVKEATCTSFLFVGTLNAQSNFCFTAADFFNRRRIVRNCLGCQPLLFQSSHTALFSARRVILISVSSTNYECRRSFQGWLCFFRGVKFKLAATACCFPAPHGGFVGAALPSSNINVEVRTETERFV